MRKLLTLFLWLSILVPLRAQKSIMQEQSDYYRQFHLESEHQWDSLNNYFPQPLRASFKNLNTCTASKRIFGWHPYWMGTTYTNYQWNLLTDLCYFDYTITPTTGQNSNTSFAWNTSTAVANALSNGVNAEFCVTLFSGHSTFLGSTSAMNTCITNIVSLLNSRGGKGVNIDFEGMAASDKTPFSNFIIQLKNALQTANPGYELSIALPAVDWNAVFDISTLIHYADLFIIMGYDYYWSGSTTAGPEDPLYDFETSYNYTLSRSITYYLKQGVSPNKLLLGLPYYGREWPTAGNTAPSATSGTGNTVTYRTLRQNTNAHYNTQRWEPNSFSPYYPYQVGTQWWQCFIDDAYSLGKRYDVVNQRGIGGIGIWALGYDDGYTDLWDELKNKLSTCAVVPCQDTIYDMGGPFRNYYDNEDYTYTIAPAGATTVSLAFSTFQEGGSDTLFLYDGPGITSPLIGAYTGNNSPGTVNSTGASMTMHYKSDGSANQPGFQAIWQCQLATGITGHERESGLRVYPNPGLDQVTLHWEQKKAAEVVWSLTDIFGKTVYSQQKGLLSAGTHSEVIRVGDLPRGVYFLKVDAGDKPEFLKLVVE